MTTKPATPARKRKTPAIPASISISAAPLRSTYLVGQLDRIVTRRLAEVLFPHGLTLPQFTALSVLHARGRCSNAQLAERSFITPQAANEVVKTIEANGWVTRETDTTNRRVVLLTLTGDGETLLARCETAAAQVEQTMLHGLDDQQSQALLSMLQICVRNLRTP